MLLSGLRRLTLLCRLGSLRSLLAPLLSLLICAGHLT
tara:strand:- start:331 stop:441 length:111 start_codon:yes stop_codon:yes gene_type:complete